MAAFNTPWFNNQDKNFFNALNITKIPHVVLAAETEDFDEETTQTWIDEGFDVRYVPLLKGGAEFIQRVHDTGDLFGVSEQYAIVAYGEAAFWALEAHTKPNRPRLVAVVAYYPTAIPAVTTKFPAGVQVLVHLAGNEVGVRKNPEVLGIQAKRTTVRKRIDPGLGYGQSLKLGYKAYTYSEAQPGFAEHDLDEYDAIADGVALTRSLTTVRRGFRIEPNIEAFRDHHVNLINTGNISKAMTCVRPYAQILHIPTLTGGVGAEDVQDFYENFFTPIPAKSNASVRLLSRTIGTDRVVDELFLSLTHSDSIPWLLPGIPPTFKKIEIAMVSIFHVRGTKLESEHIYWDQASVLVQAGLLDPKMLPGKVKKKGVESLPVVGVEEARAVKRGSSKKVNDLIPDW